MSAYEVPIRSALVLFPFVALLFTLPYMIVQYRKFERIPLLKVAVTYSFIFYLMTAYFLVILPLPNPADVQAQSADSHVILEPLETLRDYIQKSDLSLERKSEILDILRSKAMLQLVFNVALTLPFGMYLRYYLRRSWWQALLMSFGLSLFFELTQLTGLYGIYAKPYRYFEVDDLICNTAGGMLGFAVAPVLYAFLPNWAALDKRARKATAQVSIVRRICATLIDWAIVFPLYFMACYALKHVFGMAMGTRLTMALLGVSCAMLYEIVCSLVSGGYTPGKRLFRLRVMHSGGTRARLWQYVVRYLLLYGSIYAAPLLIYALFRRLWSWPQTWQYAGAVAALLLSVLFFLFAFETLFKLFGGQHPYRYDLISRTRCVSVRRRRLSKPAADGILEAE